MILFYLIYLTFQQSEASSTAADIRTENWTSCEEFLMNSTFDIESVIDIDWKIFYFWNYDNDKSYNIRFSLANPLLVDRFKVELKHIDSSVDWSKAVLFMETSIDFSALYLATDVSGKFRLIPSFAFQMEKIPLMIFAMKIVKPHYLGIINCQHKLCYALAPVDKLPDENNLITAAEKIGFRGDLNQSYLNQEEVPRVLSPFAEDDEDEDEQLEIENEEYELNI